MTRSTDALEPNELECLLGDFEARYGHSSMMLATHASVADRLTPELLGLIRQNFLEGHDRFQPSHDADVLFGTLCTAQGDNIYEMLRPVQSFLFGLLDRLYPPGRQGRYRSQDVARLIRHHLCALPSPRRDSSGHRTQFVLQNLWRVIAIDEPATALGKLHDSTRERLELPRDELANAPRGGAIVSVTQDVFARFQDEIAYVEATDLIADGRSEESVAMLDFLVETGFDPAYPGLTSPAVLLAEEQAFVELRKNTIRGYRSARAENAPERKSRSRGDNRVSDDVEIDIDRFNLQDSPVSRAVRRGEREALHKALERFRDRINLLDRFGFAPLHHAVINDRMDLAGLLLEAGADPDVRSAFKSTPLLLCGNHGMVDLARDLLRRGADPMQKTIKSTTPVMVACHYGHRELVRLLLDQPAMNADHISLANHENATALHWAVGVGDQIIVDMLLDAGATLPIRDHKQWNLLHFAVYSQSLPMTLRMMNLGVPVNDVDQRGATPLHFACWDRASVEIAELLLECGADPFRAMELGWTPSRLAAAWNNSDCLALLSRYETFTQRHVTDATWNGGIDSLAYLVDHHDLKLNATSTLEGLLKSDRVHVLDFIFARAGLSQYTFDEIFKKILEYGKPKLLRHIRTLKRPVPPLPEKAKSWVDVVDAKADHRDATIAELIAFDAPLMDLVGTDGFLVTAAKDGLTESVDALLARKVDLDVRDAALFTPLAAALDAGHIDLARRFLDDGADPNATVGSRANPTIFGKGKEGLSLLAERGADFGARNLAGATFLHSWAESMGSKLKSTGLDTEEQKVGLEIALAKGLSPDAIDYLGESPLHKAARHNRAVAAGLLIAAGAAIDFPGHDGFTPYFRALECRSDAVSEALLAAGARQDYRTPGGWTALHVAAERDRHEILPVLWDRLGARDSAATLPPRTALQLAAEANASKVVEFLVSQGVPPDHRAGSTPPPLHLALETQALKAATALVRAGADCFAVDMRTGLDAMTRANALQNRISKTDLDVKDAQALIALMRSEGGSGVNR